MMGFGFVVARFGLFLREFAALPKPSPHHHSGLSLWVGATLVVLGVATNVGAAIKHWHTVRLLERGQRLQFSPWSLEMVMSMVLAVLGLLMVGYLLVGS
jgi:putative membrane protein